MSLGKFCFVFYHSMIFCRDPELETTSMYNPSNQHLYRCLAHRATRPGMVLPEVASDLLELMGPPQEVYNTSLES